MLYGGTKNIAVYLFGPYANVCSKALRQAEHTLIYFARRVFGNIQNMVNLSFPSFSQQ